MSKLLLQPSSTALWHALVNDAEHELKQQLDTELESYLVFLLMRYADRPEIAQQVLALDYLESQLINGQAREDKLREVADACLLYSGLFPQRAERRRVKASYYVNLGRSAYMQLGHITAESLAAMYRQISTAFVQMMDVLRTIRDFCTEDKRQDLLRLHELWQDTHSRHAYQQLFGELQPQAIPANIRNQRRH